MPLSRCHDIHKEIVLMWQRGWVRGVVHRCGMVLRTSCRLGLPRPASRDALEVKGPQRGPQQRLDRRLEEVAKAVGGRCCRLQMPLRRALGVRGTVAGHRLGSWREGGGVGMTPWCDEGGGAPPLPMHPCPPVPIRTQ